MHELSIANEILKIVQEHASAANVKASDVTAVGIRLGAWSCVQEQSLQNSFRWLVDQTPFESARLEFHRIDEVQEMEVQEMEVQEMIVEWIEIRDQKEEN
jgi:Zn finger protein HypA/HybF involved in hydrogenase expression